MSLPASEEPLDVIRANECHDLSLTSGRFRRMFQELDNAQTFRQSVADALAALRAEYDDHEFSAVWRPWLLERLDATIAALGLAPKEDNGTN